MKEFFSKIGKNIAIRFRKMVISLKRNYYVIPLFFVAICCMQFTFSLDKLSNIFARVNNDYCCLYIFIITLLSILSIVAYLNYSGKSHPKYMLIIYLVMLAVQLTLDFIIYNANSLNLIEEKQALAEAIASNNQTAIDTYTIAVNNGTSAGTSIMVHIVLSFVTLVFVLTAPLMQKLFRKISFKSITVEEAK